MVSVRAGARARYWHSNNKALEIARDVKAWLSGRYRERQEWLSKLHAARVARDRVELAKLKRERLQQKQAAIGSGKGRLPDFVVIGAKKCGTTLLYHLLTQHPYVDPAAKKELHYFDVLFEEEDVEWYRRCFPQPTWKDGRRTITGEGTPGYLFHPLAPERMVQAVPQARLIALLRNPVDRAYSDYHQGVRKGREPRTFEEAIEQALEAEETRPLDEEDEASEHEDHAGPDNMRRGHLSRGIYVDQLLRWSEYFSEEQMLVLKSEDFFERPSEALKPVLDFLDLPDWEPEASEIRNKGNYEQAMDPAIRQRLEEFFEPHNRRLYEYLGVDFGW